MVITANCSNDMLQMQVKTATVAAWMEVGDLTARISAIVYTMSAATQIMASATVHRATLGWTALKVQFPVIAIMFVLCLLTYSNYK